MRIAKRLTGKVTAHHDRAQIISGTHQSKCSSGGMSSGMACNTSRQEMRWSRYDTPPHFGHLIGTLARHRRSPAKSPIDSCWQCGQIAIRAI